MALTTADIQSVYSLLQNALSQDEKLRKPSEAALSNWENRPGFCSCLMEIISARDLDGQHGARWLAAVYFKNSIARYWRNRRDSSMGIRDGEKSYLRPKLLEQLKEENNQVAVQLALLISKIARFDYPKEWPELFPSLVQKLQSSDVLLTERVYLVLNQILKELSTKRLAADQKHFAEITSQIFEYTWHHWCSDTQSVLQQFGALLSQQSVGNAPLMSGDEERMFSLTCERWLLCLKSLGRMLKFGFPSDAKSAQEVPAVVQVAPALLQAVQSLIQVWQALRQRQLPLALFVERACLKLMKIINDVQTTHPYSFSKKGVLPVVLDYCFRQVTEVNSPGAAPTFERFLIQCMIFIKSVLGCTAYRQGKVGRVAGDSSHSISEAKGRLASEAWQIVESFFEAKRVVFLCSVLVQRYFVLTQADLQEWGNDPEGFHHEQDMVQWKDKLRPCAEALYLILFEHYKEVLAPVVMEMLKQAMEGSPAPASADSEVLITPALLLKDACYHGVGVANYDLYDNVDFLSWYSNVLALEVASRHPNARILRRRVAWLLGCWVSKVKEDLRRPIYGSLLRLLGEGDPAVQLAACNSLRALIDDCHFYEEEFVEFSSPCLQVLFQFMQTASEFDSQLQVFNLVSLIIERLGDKIVPCTPKIMAFLPKVWQESEGQSLLRIQVLLALQRLLTALGTKSNVTYDLLLPILQYSTDIKQPDNLAMLEDGMQLWQATLRHAPVMVPPLIGIFPHLAEVMDKSYDHVQTAMRILESYILLGGAEFLQQHAQAVVQILDGVVGNVKEKGMSVTLPVIDLLIQCFPAESPPLLEPVLKKLVMIVVRGQGESDTIRAHSAAVLARVLLQNSTYFGQLLSNDSMVAALRHQQQDTGSGTPGPLILFVDAWLDKIDSLSAIAKRKLSAMALCILLTSTDQQILERLEQILSVCTSVLQETEGENDTSVPYGYDYWIAQDSGGEDGAGDGEAGECARRRQVYTADPVNNVALGPMLKEKLQACSSVHGEAAFNAALARVHPSVLEQLRQCIQTS